MNKIYRVIWNAVLNRYDVTSEFSRVGKKTKSSCSQVIKSSAGPRKNPGALRCGAMLLLMSVLTAMSALATTTDVVLDTFTPSVNGNGDQAGATIVSNGDTVNLSGSLDSVATGNNGSGLGLRLQDLVDQGFDFITGKDLVRDDVLTIDIGAFDKNIVIHDSITNSDITVSVYDSNVFTETIIDIASKAATIPAINAEQYIGLRLGTVDSTGGTLNINLDNPTSVPTLVAKQSVLAYADGSGTAASNINWTSKNTLNFNASVISEDGIYTQSYGRVATFPEDGQLTGYDGTTQFNMASLEDLQIYNDWLISELQKGNLDPNQYVNEFNRAITIKTGNISYKVSDEIGDEAVFQPVGLVNVIRASGANATGTLTSDGELTVVGSIGGIMHADNGGLIVNNGILSILRTVAMQYDGNVFVVSDPGSRGINNGVINANLSTDPTIIGRAYSVGTLAQQGAHFDNSTSGIINVAMPNLSNGGLAEGIRVTNTASADNYGTINVGVTGKQDSINGLIGARVLTGGQFINQEGGTIYLGRAPQFDNTQATEDVYLTTPPSGPLSGIHIEGTGNPSAENAGRVVIGSLTHRGIGMVANGTTGTLTNALTGIIDILGAVADEVPAQNIGMLATNATNVFNEGTINLGEEDQLVVYAVGLKAYDANDKASKITSSGVININGYAHDTLRNYGAWAEGKNAEIILTGGAVNLRGDGAIGVHARNGGTITVDGGSINFVDGDQQIGFFAYGTGSNGQSSTIMLNSTPLDSDGIPIGLNVDAVGSTLFRIENGASISSHDDKSMVLIASGVDSTALQVTGKETVATFAGDITVSGDRAVALRVEGGATGTITADANLILSGSGAVAGIVDGSYYDLAGTASGVAGRSVLTSAAWLTTDNTVSGTYGYILRHGGELIHTGVIDLTQAGSTGVLVNGGILTNQSRIMVNGTAVNIQGADSFINNTGLVQATDGTAAYLLGADASLSLSGNGETQAGGSAHGILLDTGATALTVDGATITMMAGGSGNAIENKAEIAGIQLKDTMLIVGDGVGVRTGASLAATNSGLIEVNGSGTGILFANSDGSVTDNRLEMSDSADLVINVNSADGKGIVTHSSQDLYTGASVNINDVAGGPALIVSGTTGRVIQSGNLISQSLTNPLVDIDYGTITDFVNSGTLQARNTTQEAVTHSTGNGIAFTNLSGGRIVGQVNLLAGDNTVTLMTGSSGTDFTTGEGDDVFVLQGLTVADTGAFHSLDGGEGTNTLIFDNAVYTLDDADNIRHMSYINLTRQSTLTLENMLLALGNNQDDGVNTGFTIDAGSLLQVNSQDVVTFNSQLNGTGTVAVDMTGNAFSFTQQAAQNAFSGTLVLENTRFALAEDNTRALVNATLQLGAGSVTTVGDGVQSLGALAFDGGTVKFDTGTPGETVAKNTIHTRDGMDLLGTGTVEVNIGSIDNSRIQVDGTLSLLEQDETNAQLQLATSDGPVVGSGGNLALQDQVGNLITDATTTDITQQGLTVAKGTYDYRLTSGEGGDGLYIGYGLTRVELLGTGEQALSLSADGKTGNAADLSARVTGSGDLAIDTGEGQRVSLSNLANDYTGNTEVRSGTLQMLNDNVLGHTTLLSLAADTTVDMNGHRQIVEILSTRTGARLDLNGGELTLAQGGISEGELAGYGALTIAAKTLTVMGGNQALNAIVTIANGAQATLDSAVGLGSGDIVNAGLLTLKGAVGQLGNALSEAGNVALQARSDITLTGDNSLFSGLFTLSNDSQLTVSQAVQLGSAAVFSEGSLVLNTVSDWTLTNGVTGSGSLTKIGTGIVSLTSAVAYTGQTDIHAGGLLLGSSEAPMTLVSQQVNIANGAFMGGVGGVAGTIDNQGTLFVGPPALPSAPVPMFQVASALMQQTTDNPVFTVDGDLNNSGTVFIGQPGGEAGNRLLVKGNYSGDNGLLYFNTVLGDDLSVTDSLQIMGDTQGTTRVSISNAGGLGAQTLNGIALIKVGGLSEGEFVQEGRIVAGAYDYNLTRGTDQNAGNWYLTNVMVDGVPLPPDMSGSMPSQEETGAETQRPEAGSYIDNLAAANTMFNTRLHDRLGETQYIDAITGEQKVTSLWLRNVGGHTNWRSEGGQLKTQSNRYVVQLGGDLARWSTDGQNRLHLGLMVGHGYQSSNTTAGHSGYRASGSVTGYSTGLYGTWYQNDAERNGLYVDGWVQYSWFDNKVNGESLAGESYKSQGVTASLETGYTYKMGALTSSQGSTNDWFIQPKAQVTRMGVKADNHTEANGTRVSGKGNDNVQTRLGMKTYLKGHHKMDDGKDREFQPFIEANWIHNTSRYGVSMDGASVSQDGTRNLAELKTGVEGQLSKKVNLWGNMGVQLGDKGYSDVQAMVGVKINF